MNSIVSSFAKLAACAAVIIGAPLIVASASDLYRIEVEKYLEYKACLVAAELNNLQPNCKL